MTPIRPIDADGHVMEVPDQIAALLPPALADLGPRRTVDDQGRGRHMVAGELRPHVPAPPEGWNLPRGGVAPEPRLADMDAAGIARAVLFPTLGLTFAGVERLDVQGALCRAYNDWLAGFCTRGDGRLIGVGVVPQGDPAAAGVEARRAVSELGFRAITMRPNPIRARGLDHPDWEPLWSLLEQLDVPLAVHEGTTGDVPQSGRDRFESYAMRHVCSHPHEQQIACVGLVMGGVLERHPALRVVFLESGCGWLPHWLERMDEHTASWGHCLEKLPRTPSEYFLRQCFISCEPDEKGVPAFVDQLGDECLLFASDYPHPDAIAENVVGGIADRPELGEESKRRILETNAKRCFGLS